MGRFPSMTPSGERLAPLIDHTLLAPVATWRDAVRLCREALHYGFATVCVNPALLDVVVSELRDSTVRPCTVIGFPLGATSTAVKVFEAHDAVQRGAEELDMVLSIGALKSGRTRYVREEIAAVVQAAKGRVVKVILETPLLAHAEKIAACRLAVAAGAHFVKTSTGCGGGGATVSDVRLLRRSVPRTVGVKASGGIRTAQDACRLITAGATRIGTSAGVAMVTR